MQSDFVKPGELIEVSVTVRNDSVVDGEATLFLFIHDLVASIARPLLELKGVRKIVLRGRERGRVSWRLPVDDLRSLARISIASWSRDGSRSVWDKALIRPDF